MRGIFITIEGGDGAGKTTQIRNITEFFESRGMTVLQTREPGGTPIGEKIRELLLDKANSEMTSITEMFLYAASRAQHVNDVILPALENDLVVICDRFVDSSVAYQGLARGLGDMVRDINVHATSGLTPDITFWLDIDPAKGKMRAGNTGEHDRIESEGISFHDKVRLGYRNIADAEPDRVKIIDAEKSIEDMRFEIESHLEELFARRQAK